MAKNIQRCVIMCKSIQTCTRIYKNGVQQYTNMHKNILKQCATIYKHAQTFSFLRKLLIFCKTTSNMLRARQSRSRVRSSASLALAACCEEPCLLIIGTRCMGAYCTSSCCMTASTLWSSGGEEGENPLILNNIDTHTHTYTHTHTHTFHMRARILILKNGCL